MKNRAAKLILIALLCTAAYYGAAKESRELEKTLLVRTVAVDYIDGAVHITATAGTGTEKSAIRVLEAEGESVADGVEKLKNKTNIGVAEFSHTEHIIIGEQSAKYEGISELLDYISRSTDMRTDIKLYIAKNTGASAILKWVTGNDESPADVLTGVSEKADMLMNGHAYSCRDITARLMRHNTALVFAISQTDGKVSADGFGILKDGRLLDFTNTTETKGICIVENTAKSDSMVIDTINGAVTVRLTDVFCTASPIIDSSEMSGIKLRVKADSGVTLLRGDTDISDENVRRKLENAMNKELKSYISAALYKSELLNTDFLRIGERCRILLPLSGKIGGIKFENNPNAEIVQIEIKANIQRTYDAVEYMGG